MCINASDRPPVQCYSTPSSAAVPRRHICTRPTTFFLGIFPSPLSFSFLFFFFFFDWLRSMLISASHYLLEYSGECFQLLPFQLFYTTWFMTFKFLEVLQLFCQGPQSHVKPVDFSRASALSWPRSETTRRWERGCGRWREGGAGASCNNPARICWIKSLHLDVIVPPLCWDLLLPQRAQMSGPKMATCQDTPPHLVSSFTKTKRLPLCFTVWLMMILFTSSGKYTSLRWYGWNQAAQRQTIEQFVRARC